MLRFLFQCILFSILLTVLFLYLLLQYLHTITEEINNNNLSTSYEQTVNIQEKDMILHFINLEIGKSTIIQLGERAILMDVGHKKDTLTLLAYIQDHGITNITEILLSNPAEENTGGLPSIMEHFPTAKVYVPALTKDQYPKDLTRILLTLRAGDHLVLSENQKVEIEILSPLRPLFTDEANNSMVSLLRYRDLRVLLTNDIREEAESRLIEHHPLLRAHIITVPDRPNGISNTQELIQKLNPQAAVMLEMPCSECKDAAQKVAREYAQEWSDFFFVPIGENMMITFENGMYTTPKEQTQ
ncbi:ComEC/Rec2 family competence protein [Ammoniphilus sp. CFH 90114]|uniref:ComEC/Rec2 family competence protein n=1 Tax=Ammoniphilus sp. CFH 90114 TaxID=2493665 RepID=UPI00100DD9D6|nr:hypothetical protein [Ammoniphilus sp. CFH 90114]RXT08117.1 hypothetical protein EIZ39_11975 [Ammoniphilus sp. CFH 90114]